MIAATGVDGAEVVAGMPPIQVLVHGGGCVVDAPPQPEDPLVQRQPEMGGELEAALLERGDGFGDDLVRATVGDVCEVA